MNKDKIDKLIIDAISLLIVKLGAVDEALRSAYRETRLNDMPTASNHVQSAIEFLRSKQSAPMPTDELKLIPFDWDKYQAGWEACTGDGKPATQGHKFDTHLEYCLAFILNDDSVQTFTIKGEYFIGGEDYRDLFLKAKTKTVTFWVNTYKSNCIGPYNSEYETKYFAKEGCLGQESISYEVDDE